MSVCAPASMPAVSFSRTPPTGFTSPREVISPVMASMGMGGFSVIALISATHRAMPALGPSIGMPPGTLNVMS